MTIQTQIPASELRTTAYRAASDEPELVLAPRKTFVSLLGTGSPESRLWRRQNFLVTDIARQLAAAGLAPRGVRTPHFQYDFLPSAHQARIAGFYTTNPLSELHFRALAEVADSTTADDLAAVRRRSHYVADGDDFELFVIAEERVVQVMHHGPFATVSSTLARLGAAADAFGVARNGPQQEIHLHPLNDDTADGSIRTILRVPVA